MPGPSSGKNRGNASDGNGGAGSGSGGNSLSALANSRHYRRRPHTKSRNGCTTCKRRRVKCDETRPVCKNCQHLRLECRFISPVALTCADLQIMNLKLLHHYLFVVSKTIADSGISTQQIWTEDVVDMGFRYPFLMHAVLMISATHLSQKQPKEYCNAVMQHRSEALTLLRSEVQKISSQNLDALVATSVLLILDALANAAVPSRMTPSSLPASTWLHHVRGAATILLAVGVLPPTSKFYSFMGVDLLDLANLSTLKPSDGDSGLKCFMPELKKLYPVATNSPYFMSLAFLDKLNSQRNCADYILRVFSFPALMDAPFVKLLSDGDKGAKTVVGAYYRLVRTYVKETHDKIWFLHGVSTVLPIDMDTDLGGLGFITDALPISENVESLLSRFDASFSGSTVSGTQGRTTLGILDFFDDDENLDQSQESSTSLSRSDMDSTNPSSQAQPSQQFPLSQQQSLKQERSQQSPSQDQARQQQPQQQPQSSAQQQPQQPQQQQPQQPQQQQQQQFQYSQNASPRGQQFQPSQQQLADIFNPRKQKKGRQMYGQYPRGSLTGTQLSGLQSDISIPPHVAERMSGGIRVGKQMSQQSIVPGSGAHPRNWQVNRVSQETGGAVRGIIRPGMMGLPVDPSISDQLFAGFDLNGGQQAQQQQQQQLPSDMIGGQDVSQDMEFQQFMNNGTSTSISSATNSVSSGSMVASPWPVVSDVGDVIFDKDLEWKKQPPSPPVKSPRNMGISNSGMPSMDQMMRIPSNMGNIPEVQGMIHSNMGTNPNIGNRNVVNQNMGMANQMRSNYDQNNTMGMPMGYDSVSANSQTQIMDNYNGANQINPYAVKNEITDTDFQYLQLDGDDLSNDRFDWSQS